MFGLKDKKRKLLNEQEGGGMSGDIGGFVGRGGQDVDNTYFGPYHPDYGDIEKLLQLQLDRNNAIMKWNNDITPILKNIFELVGVEYRVDEPLSKYDKEALKKFINDSNKMKEVDTGIKYDEIDKQTEKNSIFINRSDQWKVIYNNKKNGD